MEPEQKEMTQEEMKAEMEARKAEWNDFIENLKANPEEPVTKKDLLYVVEVISENLQGVGEMTAVALHNTQALHNNFNQFMAALGGKTSIPTSRTKGGIILPH